MEVERRSHIIDPKGDVILSVGATHNILVCSKFLTFHSKVFAAMFTGHFSEALKMSSNAPSSGAQPAQPTQVELPEDKPGAMLLLCHVLHGKVLALKKPSSSLLLALTVLADKYDCIEPVVPLIVVWTIEEFFSDDKDGQLVWMDINHLAIFYLANLPREFGIASQHLVRWTSGSYHNLCNGEVRDILPASIFGELFEPLEQVALY